jgi:hypothetical protein
MRQIRQIKGWLAVAPTEAEGQRNYGVDRCSDICVLVMCDVSWTASESWCSVVLFILSKSDDAR